MSNHHWLEPTRPCASRSSCASHGHHWLDSRMNPKDTNGCASILLAIHPSVCSGISQQNVISSSVSLLNGSIVASPSYVIEQFLHIQVFICGCPTNDQHLTNINTSIIMHIKHHYCASNFTIGSSPAHGYPDALLPSQWITSASAEVCSCASGHRRRDWDVQFTLNCVKTNHQAATSRQLNPTKSNQIQTLLLQVPFLTWPSRLARRRWRWRRMGR